MRLLYIFAAVLAVSLAKEVKEDEIEDLEAAASVELLKTDLADKEALDTAASSYSSNNNYIPPSQRPPKQWNQNYVTNQNNPPVYPPLNNPTYVPTAPQNDYYPPNNYQPTYPQNNYQPSVPQNNYQPGPPQNTNYQPSVPQNTNYQPTNPQNTNYQPSNPQNTNYPPVAPSPIPQYPPNTQTPQNDHNYPPTWTTTQVVPVIKNDQFFGENGNYKYEYQIGDGTHVGEEGYLTNPNTDHESVVKKGWYSFVGGDGRVYTVKWWADDSGYHAYGDHLPTPPPVPPAIQAALDQAAKDEANKVQPTQPTYYPKPTPPPTYYPKPTQPPTYYPTQPTYYPTQQTYYPNNYYPNNNNYNNYNNFG